MTPQGQLLRAGMSAVGHRRHQARRVATAGRPSAVRPPQPLTTRPDGVVKNKGLLTAAIMIAMIMQVLDTTIANVALPHMRASLARRRTRSAGC